MPPTPSNWKPSPTPTPDAITSSASSVRSLRACAPRPASRTSAPSLLPMCRAKFGGRAGLRRPFDPFAEAQQRPAHTDQVTGAQRCRPDDGGVVEVGAAARAGVGDHELLALADDAGVQRVHGGVAEQADVARL